MSLTHWITRVGRNGSSLTIYSIFRYSAWNPHSYNKQALGKKLQMLCSPRLNYGYHRYLPNMYILHNNLPDVTNGIFLVQFALPRDQLDLVNYNNGDCDPTSPASLTIGPNSINWVDPSVRIQEAPSKEIIII
jgi:hypothetical protein